MKKILVVEDDQPSRELIREILETCGYQVLEARDGREALQRVEETAPDLVLLDLSRCLPEGERKPWKSSRTLARMPSCLTC